MTDDEKYAPIIPIKPYDPNHVPTRSRKFFSFGPAALGIAILVGGSDRFSSPGFDIPSDLAPWWVWGVVFVVLTLIMAPYAFWGSNRVFWPAFLCSAVFLFWAICLGLSALETDTGAFTGFCFYGWYGVCVAGIASRDDHRPSVEEAMKHLYLHMRNQGPVPDPYLHRQNVDGSFLMLLVTLSGLGQLVTDSPPPTVQAQMGTLYSKCWATGLLVFGLLALVGMFWKENLTALKIEQSARFALGCLSLSYVFVAFAAVGTDAIGVAFLVLAFSFACFVRAYAIHAWFKFLRKAANAH